MSTDSNKPIKDLFPACSDKLWIDVRSPFEYEKGHLPGAKNLPLFTNEERIKVGTTYVQESREKAILVGLDAVGPKLGDMVRTVLDWTGGDKAQPIMLYCFRGGMRSSSVAWLLRLYGFQVETYKGGYKAFRQQLKKLCANIERPYIIHGPTGSGKTDILQELDQLGAQVIDLEGIAKHRGSAFGYLPGVEQPTNEMVANEITCQLLTMDLTQPIFFESESKRIGCAMVPDPLYERMSHAKLISIDVPKEARIQRIIEIYSPLPNSFLIDCFHKIEKRLGHENTTKAIEAVESGDLHTAVDIALRYYDKGYKRSSEAIWKDDEVRTLTTDIDSPAEEAKRILEMVHTNY